MSRYGGILAGFDPRILATPVTPSVGIVAIFQNNILRVTWGNSAAGVAWVSR